MPKVYLDETGFDTFYYRPYAYALRGQIVKARISGKRYERMSLVAARADGKLIAPMVYKGTMDSSLFEAWFGQFLLKELKEPSVIIMDNARFHRMAVLREMAQREGHIVNQNKKYIILSLNSTPYPFPFYGLLHRFPSKSIRPLRTARQPQPNRTHLPHYQPNPLPMDCA